MGNATSEPRGHVRVLLPPALNAPGTTLTRALGPASAATLAGVHAFVLSFGVILLAELGDKSQLMALAFAARYRPITVLVAISQSPETMSPAKSANGMKSAMPAASATAIVNMAIPPFAAA